MTDTYGQMAFTEAVKAMQDIQGSRNAYARSGTGLDRKRRLGQEDSNFIRAQDCFFLASVSETGWPYIQYRGGSGGFLHVLDDRRLGFADFCGNRQYITTGNISGNDRVALLLVDFAQRRHLKIFGRMRSIEPADDPELAAPLTDRAYDAAHNAVVERLFVIGVEAFDWNCPQHIRPRLTEEHILKVFEHGAPSARPYHPGSLA
jgi:uncharacterized protein